MLQARSAFVILQRDRRLFHRGVGNIQSVFAKATTGQALALPKVCRRLKAD
jgi:hypothetical protein